MKRALAAVVLAVQIFVVGIPAVQAYRFAKSFCESDADTLSAQVAGIGISREEVEDALMIQAYFGPCTEYGLLGVGVSVKGLVGIANIDGTTYFLTYSLTGELVSID